MAFATPDVNSRDAIGAQTHQVPISSAKAQWIAIEGIARFDDRGSVGVQHRTFSLGRGMS
jgi:hypothetical protein